jgi:hypothetical protein
MGALVTLARFDAAAAAQFNEIRLEEVNGV